MSEWEAWKEMGEEWRWECAAENRIPRCAFKTVEPRGRLSIVVSWFFHPFPSPPSPLYLNPSVIPSLP